MRFLLIVAIFFFAINTNNSTSHTENEKHLKTSEAEIHSPKKEIAKQGHEYEKRFPVADDPKDDPNKGYYRLRRVM